MTPVNPVISVSVFASGKQVCFSAGPYSQTFTHIPRPRPESTPRLSLKRVNLCPWASIGHLTSPPFEECFGSDFRKDFKSFLPSISFLQGCVIKKNPTEISRALINSTARKIKCYFHLQGALIRRSSKVKSGRNIKENDNTKTLKMESEAYEVSSIISSVEVAEDGEENYSRREVKTRKIKEAEPSERTRCEETVCHEKEELLGPEVSSGHFLRMISSYGTTVTTVPTNSSEPDKTQAKAMSDWSEYVVKEEGLWKCRHCNWVYPVMNPGVEFIQKHKEHCQTMNTIHTLFEKEFRIKHNIEEGSETQALLDEEGEVIDYENKDTELVKDEIVIQNTTDANKNQPAVSETIMQNSQDAFVRVQDETQLSDQWSTLENSASTGKVEEIVEVLKEQQSHDLLCPVCGSCITKRVILRKRKRISTVSVDRWIQEPDNDAQAALLEGRQQITEEENDQPAIPPEDGDATEAYGCLACFSIFFQRVVAVRHLLKKSESVKESLEDDEPYPILQDMREIPDEDEDKESFHCLPLRNTWQKNRKNGPRAAAAKAMGSGLSHEVKDSHGVATQSISDQTSITATTTLTILSSMENGGSKETIYAVPDTTNISQDVNGSDNCSQLKEQFPPTKRSEDQLAELHLDDSSRLHAKHEEREHAKTETAEGDGSIILLDVLPSNIETSIQEDAGSKKIKYTLTESTNITEYVNVSDKSSQLKEHCPPTKRLEDQLAELHSDDARLHAKIQEQEHANGKTPVGGVSVVLPDVLLSNTEANIQENVGVKNTKYTLTETTSISQYVNVSDKSSQLKEHFPPAKRSEDQPAELHSDDAKLHAKHEEQEHGNAKTPVGRASIILPDVLRSIIETKKEEMGIRKDPATYEEESNNFLAVSQHEELQQDTPALKDASSKTDYMCNCIPISIQSVWSIWSLKESTTEQHLKEPLLAKENLEENVSVVLNESISHGILQSDDKESETTTGLLSSRVESSSLLTKQKPSPLHSKKKAISTNVTVPPIQTVIEVEPIDGSQRSEAATTLPELTRTTTAQPQATEIVTEWDVIKSTVYGGLTVSLTSLGVVSSAAGGEAKTLTVIAICLSNLVAGLFLILNNMLDLDHYHKDQFIDRVGHSFWFNGSVAIVSYLIFGSLAPITYALSFRNSDDRIYKFIATSAVSLVCIILLAVGRARISKKSYIRTVTLYIVTGFWSAVAGFFAGEYIKKLLEKWGF